MSGEDLHVPLLAGGKVACAILIPLRTLAEFMTATELPSAPRVLPSWSPALPGPAATLALKPAGADRVQTDKATPAEIDKCALEVAQDAKAQGKGHPGKAPAMIKEIVLRLGINRLGFDRCSGRDARKAYQKLPYPELRLRPTITRKSNQ
jgi:hypothetical protein